jgi:choline dehydrogenase-like flavoprotein
LYRREQKTNGFDMIGSEQTTFSLDNLGRFLCNTLQEAMDSSSKSVGGQKRDFDVIVIGGGTFGSALAEHLFINDPTHSRRILVLEAGPFVLPEHVQNLPYMGGVPDMRKPWESHPALSYPGLLFAIGGRSLSWGGWSPELLLEEMLDWPPTATSDLKNVYFKDASDLIGVTETNDFIYGPLHNALRRQLYEGLLSPSNPANLKLKDVPEHPAVRYNDPAISGPINKETLLDWLGLPANDPMTEQELHLLFKLEAPLAVQAQAEPGHFPGNKFSTVPLLTRAARLAAKQADGIGPDADARKRLMIVPNCHVQDIITETQADGWVRVTGVRVWQNGISTVVPLAAPVNGRQGVVVIANGTVESTRLALSTFKDSLAGRAAQRMGENLMAHLRSNFAIRIPKASLKFLSPSTQKALHCSALFVKAKTTVAGKDRFFHFQITASGLSKFGDDSEAELHKKIPTLEHINDLLRADDNHVVIMIRGIGDMCPGNPDSRIELSGNTTDFGRPTAVVSIGNSKSATPGSVETEIDKLVWGAMDDTADKLALIFAAGEPFEILAKGKVIPVPAGSTTSNLKALHPHGNRRDDLGTTHHDAGTLRMHTDPAQGVTNDYGRIHDTTNCYVAGPALFPTVGSPNPMLTGVALARRTADLLAKDILPKAQTFTASGPNIIQLFDGTAASFKKWCKVGPDGIGFSQLNGEMISYGTGTYSLLYYGPQTLTNFILNLEFQILDGQNQNSGVFVRFPNPLHELTADLAARAAAEGMDVKANPQFRPIFSGFEVQIDDHARGDQSKDFYGIKPEPDGKWKNRTGAIYKIPAGDFIWHLNQHESKLQDYKPGPALIPGTWFRYEIKVNQNLYTVKLTNLQNNASETTTTFQNTDNKRGLPDGFIGLQAYPNSPIKYRNITIQPL